MHPALPPAGSSSNGSPVSNGVELSPAGESPHQLMVR